MPLFLHKNFDGRVREKERNCVGVWGSDHIYKSKENRFLVLFFSISLLPGEVFCFFGILLVNTSNMRTIQLVWGIWEISSNKETNSTSKVINKNDSINKHKTKINDLK